MSTINLIVGDADESATITPGEVFNVTVKLASGASDVSVTLGTLTAPYFIAVYGGVGVSYKVTGGTDALGADPFSIIATSTGMAHTSVLLSNSSGSERTVYIYAEEV